MLAKRRRRDNVGGRHAGDRSSVGASLARDAGNAGGRARVPAYRTRSSHPWALIGCSRQPDCPVSRYPIPPCGGHDRHHAQPLDYLFNSASRNSRRRILPTLLFGSSSTELDVPRALVSRELFRADRRVVRTSSSARVGLLLQIPSRLHSISGVRYTDGSHFQHFGVQSQYVFNFIGEYVETGHQDHVLLSVHDLEESFLVHQCDIPGQQPAIRP